MSYQLQFRSLVAEFRKAGLNPDSAVRIASILSNSRQEMRRGPVTTDTTPDAMKQVDSGVRKYYLRNIDFEEGDPDHRKDRISRTEEPSYPQQANTVQDERPPQETESFFGVTPGQYVDVKSQGDGVSVGLRVANQQGFLLQDSQSGSLVGRSFRAECETTAKGLIRFWVEPRGDELIWRFQFSEDALRAIIDDQLGIEPNAPNSPGSPGTPLGDALVNVKLTDGGLCFTRNSGEEICISTVNCTDEGP